MSTTITFTGFSPDQPVGRSFGLWKYTPDKNKREDLTRDLERFIRSLDEVVQLQLNMVDRFTDLYDPDLCSDTVIDDMLLDMGNPFDWADLELTSVQRRKLLLILVEIYKSKGTAVGIENTILFLLGIDCEVVLYTGDGWVLGVDELGSGAIAQIGNWYTGTYDFTSLPAPWTISFSVDGEAPQQVTFVAGDFVSSSAATADEVAQAVAVAVNGAGAYVVNDGESALLTGTAGPYNLVGGEVLKLLVGVESHDVVFKAGDIDTPGAATIDEVINAILEAGIPGLQSGVLPVTDFLGIGTLLRGPEAVIESVNDPGNTASVALGIALGTVGAGVAGNRLFVYSETVGRDASIECTSPGVSADSLLFFAGDPVGATGGSVLAPSDSYTLYSFDLETATAVDAETEALMRRIAEYMKCAHEHLVEIRIVDPLPWPDGWEIGVSELDTEAELAE